MAENKVRKRITETELPNTLKQDGEILYGEDINKLATILKGGVNANRAGFESYLHGDSYRPFYYGDDEGWSDLPELREYGEFFWIREKLDPISQENFLYITVMKLGETKWEEVSNVNLKELIETVEELKTKERLKSSNISFEDDNEIDLWFIGEFERADGFKPQDLVVGQEILTVNPDEYDYWVAYVPVSSREELVKQNIPEKKHDKFYVGGDEPSPAKYNFWIDTNVDLHAINADLIPKQAGSLPLFEGEEEFKIQEEPLPTLFSNEEEFEIQEEPSPTLLEGEKEFELTYDEWGRLIIKEE